MIDEQEQAGSDAQEQNLEQELSNSNIYQSQTEGVGDAQQSEGDLGEQANDAEDAAVDFATGADADEAMSQDIDSDTESVEANDAV